MLPTDSNKLLLQWKGPFKVIQRIRGNGWKYKNFLCKYVEEILEREQEEIGAMVIESEIPDENEMNLFMSLQTETYKDVKINPALTEEQKGKIMELLE